MKRNLVIGRTNVGKTLFCIHFARYLGVRELNWLLERTDGRTEERRMTLREAEETWSDPALHRTRCLQSIRLELPRGKGNRQFLLTDTTGLSEGIHEEPTVREAMAQTLRAMMEANLILHIVDACEIGRSDASGARHRLRSGGLGAAWSQLDDQLAEFGQEHAGYLLLANKMDLPGAKDGYRALCRRFSRRQVIPVSALQGHGFREVRQHVWRLA